MKNIQMLGVICLLLVFFFDSKTVCAKNEIESTNNYFFLYKEGTNIFGISIGKFIRDRLDKRNQLFAGNNKSIEIVSQYNAQYPSSSKIIKLSILKLKGRRDAYNSYMYYKLLDYIQSQLHTRFLDCSFNRISKNCLSGDKKTSELQLGRVFGKYYSPMNPSASGTIQCMNVTVQTMSSVDAVKPFLFIAGNKYYSIYGDSSVIIHFNSDIWKEQLFAIAPLGNILFAANKNLPPTLQSCGVDGNNTIWISDMEGNIAFFDTHKNIYMPYIARCANAKKLRIPRRNLVSSVFAYDKNKDQFIEYTISSVKLSEADKLKKLADIPVAYGIISSESRILPADTFQVLLCDAGKLVYVTNTFASIKFKDKSRNIKVPIKLGDNELLVEGIFDEKNNKIHLLVRQKAKDEKNVFEVRKTWNKMRLLTVDLAIDNIGHNVIKD